MEVRTQVEMFDQWVLFRIVKAGWGTRRFKRRNQRVSQMCLILKRDQETTFDRLDRVDFAQVYWMFLYLVDDYIYSFPRFHLFVQNVCNSMRRFCFYCCGSVLSFSLFLYRTKIPPLASTRRMLGCTRAH